ncbi:MAG: outer membrane protein assembly factor BamD [Thioalkalivibrio sp.]|nr:MAG: outer membrane protein assembly factor BamD [Thioalkalivibrio sp.]
MNENILHKTPLLSRIADCRWSALLAGAGLALLLGGCATSGTPVPDERSARAAIAEAVQRGDCIGADEAMETIDQHYAGDRTATRTRLQISDACIRADEPARARRHTETLVSRSSSFAQQDYAHYLHAVAGYGVWQEGHATAASRPELLADVEGAREAVEDFALLVSRFPESRYRDEALPYLVDLHEGLARTELQIARLDMERGEYGRAAARADYVIEHYGRTRSLDDARSLTEAARARAAAAPAEAVAVADRGAAAPEPRPIDAPKVPAASSEPDRSPPMDTAPAAEPPAAEPQAAPESQRRPATGAGASDGMEWIRAQPRNAFTIQVLGLAREQGVRDFLARHSLERETAWFRTRRNGSDWFVAIAGSYPNAEAARGAMASLPPEVARNQPWIRSFGSVQDAIRGE